MVAPGKSMRPTGQRPLHFARQLVLIAAPLLFLAGIALYSLRQDRTAVEQDARDQARNLVSTLGSRWQEYAGKDVGTFLNDYYLACYVPVVLAWQKANGLPEPGDASSMRQLAERARINPLIHSVPQIRCRISNDRLITPVEYPLSPVPPDWMHTISAAQTDLMGDLEEAVFLRRNPAVAGRVLARMKAAGIPDFVLVNAEFEILMLEATQSTAAGMLIKLIDFARKYPAFSSPSGTPLADLALIQALRTESIEAAGETLSQEVFRRVMQYPSILTPEIIAASEPLGTEIVHAIETVWQAQEKTRAAQRIAMKIPLNPSHPNAEIWVQINKKAIFIQRNVQDKNHVYTATVIPGGVLEQAFINALETTRNQIPSYISPEVEIAGRSWQVVPGGLESRESMQESSVLASWTGKFEASLDRSVVLDTGDEQLKFLKPPDVLSTAFTLNFRLTQPDLLYASYRRRMWYAAALILAAAAASWIGILNAWRGYRRQVKLAEMTSNFVSSVSHELRAPLASMRLMAESLDRGRIGDEHKRKDYYRLIVQECRRLAGLVENVLDFSRMRQGRKRYEFEPIDGLALIRETVRMMEPMAKQRSLTVSFQSGAGPDLQPEWDGPAVQQAVVNLLDNAMKHSPEGSVVKVELEMTRDQKIQIAIEDQGPGIKKEEQERIFDAFYRLGSELRRETRGIGIGLSIVKHVAEAHGGRVFLESAPGRGSRFVLQLPLTPPEVRQP
jgi:signal transduction histidine kinase